METNNPDTAAADVDAAAAAAAEKREKQITAALRDSSFVAGLSLQNGVSSEEINRRAARALGLD